MMGRGTYSNLGRNKVDLVQHEHKMLVRGFLAEVFLNTPAAGALRVAGVDNMQNDIGRVNDLVQLVPDTLRLALGENGLSSNGESALLLVGILRVARLAGEQLSALQTLEVIVVHVARPARQISNRAEVQFDTLPLGLGAKRVLEGLALDSDLGSVLLEAVDVGLVLDQAHGQLVALHQVRRGVRRLRLDCRAERLEGVLRDNTGRVEPLAVRLDAGDGRLAALVRGGLGDVAAGIALRLALLEHVQRLDLLRRAAILSACAAMNVWRQETANVPIEVLALDLDVGHAIARLALPLLAGGLLLSCTHGDLWPAPTVESFGVVVCEGSAEVRFCEAWDFFLGGGPCQFSRSKPPLILRSQASRRQQVLRPLSLPAAMPPRVPVCLPRASQPQCISSTCARAFGSTPARAALGPESPNYIDVPKPLQPTFPPKPRIKGVLPRPRDIFKTRSDLPKESDEFLANSTRDPVKRPQPGKYSRDADIRLYKQRLADARKEALRTGVKELHARKVETEATEKAQLEKLFAERRAAAMAPRREVDILTETSVSKSVRDFLEGKLPSTSRSNIPEARRKAFERKMAKHAAVRQARLHDLYTQAREFIVTEEQLDDAIEKAFGTEENPMGWGDDGEARIGEPGDSPWYGPMPNGVAELLHSLKGGEGVELADDRVRKVAEKLTGGKM